MCMCKEWTVFVNSAKRIPIWIYTVVFFANMCTWLTFVTSHIFLFVDVVRTPHVLFSARDVKQHSLSKNLIMVFQEVLLNEGNAYNKENGIFTAPSNGVYTFSVQFCLYPGRYFDFAFMANDKSFKTTRIHRPSTSYFSCYNYDALTIIRINDQVKVKVIHCSSDPILHDSFSNYWNTFSGRLVYAI